MRHKLFTGSLLQIITAICFIASMPLFAQTGEVKNNYTPKYSGYFRAWHQTDFATGQGQFIMKEITLGASGDVNEFFGYKFLADITRLGKLSTSTTEIEGTPVINKATATFSDILLDAMVKITPFSDFSISGGQFKIPFSTDNLRGNVALDFVNRSLATNVAPASRDIGAMASYKVSSFIPAELYAGVFNGTGLNKSENDKTMNYVCRAVVTPVANLNLAANYYSGTQTTFDVDVIGVGFDWKIDNLLLDAEYISRDTKQPNVTIASNAVFFYSLYNIDISKEGMLKSITPAVRYDIYEPNTDVEKDEIHRITIGLTFNFAKITWAHVRFNYEKYDYKNDTKNPDKLIVEMQARF